MDPRFDAFANQLVNYCVGMQKGEHGIIQAYDNTPVEMVEAVIDAANKAGGSISDIWWLNQRLEKRLIKQLTPRGERVRSAGPLVQAFDADVCFVFRGFDNLFEMSDVSHEQTKLVKTGMAKHLQDTRVQFTRWILTRMWSPSMAQLAGMSHEQFTRFYFDTVLLNYAAMSKAMTPLANLITRTKKVKIVGPGDTKLTFSIDGIGAVKCDGHRNIPDGEVYTAPVRNSVNGILCYNTVTVTKEGKRFENVRFEFKDGKIINATCGSGDEAELNKILDTDEGARYIGEFAIGVNPYILHPIGETLFDEKIAGSFHFTPGQCYTGTPAENGNNSAIHWDIVAIQREDYGGGEIYFDGELIRKGGLFVKRSLTGLNPKKLIAA